MELPLESSEIVGTPFCVKEESYKAIKKKFEKARLGEENSEPGLVGIRAFELHLSHQTLPFLITVFSFTDFLELQPMMRYFLPLCFQLQIVLFLPLFEK